MLKNNVIIILLIIFSFSFISAQTLTITSPKMNDPISADGEIYISWNSSGIDGEVTIQWAKTSSRNNWNNIDEVGVGEGSYYWWWPNELENYRGKIIIKIFSSSKIWVKDEVKLWHVEL